MDLENKLTVAQIKEIVDLISEENDPMLHKLAKDERKSVQRLIQNKVKLIDKAKQAEIEHLERLTFETTLWKNGYEFIAGIDEVGRGPLAGPVVTAAVILPRDCSRLVGVNDSKQLSLEKRKVFDQLIKEVALEYSITVIDSNEIDRLNIYEATRLSMLKSVEQLKLEPNYLLLDAMRIDSAIPQQSLVKGDQRSLSIAAASIIAKVYRDEMMIAYSEMFPEFGFEKHMGYGTKQHLNALASYGYTPIHRQSFSPVANTRQAYESSGQ